MEGLILHNVLSTVLAISGCLRNEKEERKCLIFTLSPLLGYVLSSEVFLGLV